MFGAVGAPTGGGVSGLGLKYAVYFEGDNAQEGVPRTPASSDADYLRHGPPTRSESHACACIRRVSRGPPSSIGWRVRP